MNTEIYLWIEPLISGHKKATEKIYFNVVISGNFHESTTSELEDKVCGNTMQDIMNYADIYSNWNYGVVSAKSTNKPIDIQYADSPDKIIADKKKKELKKKETQDANNIAKILSSEKPIKLSKKEVDINEDGTISINYPSLKVNDKINFPKLWETLEKNVSGKIKEGDKVILTDDYGNVIMELMGGSFLNIGLADLSVYNSKEKSKSGSLLNWAQGLKGGLFLREDGSLDIGDLNRTFYLKIHTSALLKASKKLNSTMSELTDIKLLDYINT